MEDMEELVEDYLAKMDLLLDDDRIEWRWDTIEDIHNQVSTKKWISQAQMDLIDGCEKEIEDYE